MPKTENNKDYKAFRINPMLQEMVDDLMKKIGYYTESELFRAMIRSLHKKEFPNYVKIHEETKKNRPTLEDRERAKLEAKEKRDELIAEAEREKQEALCLQLEGTLKDNHCTYYQYCQMGQTVKRYPTTCPLSYLSEELLRTQYQDTAGRMTPEAHEKVKLMIAAGKLSD